MGKFTLSVYLKETFCGSWLNMIPMLKIGEKCLQIEFSKLYGTLLIIPVKK